MLPKCSLIKYICINAFDYNAIIVYFTVLKPGTLYVTWYSPTQALLKLSDKKGITYFPSHIVNVRACVAGKSITVRPLFNNQHIRACRTEQQHTVKYYKLQLRKTATAQQKPVLPGVQTKTSPYCTQNIRKTSPSQK